MALRPAAGRARDAGGDQREADPAEVRDVRRAEVWEEDGVDEKGIDRGSGKVVVEVSPEFYRPAEVQVLKGSPKKAFEKLGWQSRVGVKELAQLMAEYEDSRLT